MCEQNLKVKPAFGVGNVIILSAETLDWNTILPPCSASVTVNAASPLITGALRAFSISPIVTFLLIGVPEGSSTK